MDRKEYFYSFLSEAERKEIVCLDTMNDLLEQGVKKYPDDAALNDYKSELTYKLLAEETGRLRGFFKAQGLKKGMKAGIFFRNDSDFVKIFLAVTTLGAVAIPFPVQMGREPLFGSLKKFEVSYLFCADEFKELCSGLPVKVYALSDIAPADFEPAAKLEADDDCAIFFTGGTTGRPKGALLSHRALMRGGYNGCFVPSGTLRQRYYALIPYSHVFGMVRNLLTCLYTGSVMYACTDMHKMFQDFAVAKPTILVLVPALADMLFGIMTLKGMGALGGKLKMIIAGGAPVPASLTLRWNKAGVMMLPGYGLTETANLVSGNGQAVEYPDSVGIPYPAQELKLVDGELWLKGENLFKRYYNDPEETAKAFSDGWFKTGDLARFDEDGRLYIVGRIKNVIILPNGENVSPEELELLLYRVPLIKDALVKEVKNDAGIAMIAAEVFPNAAVAAKMGVSDVKKAVEDEIEKINQTLPTYMRMTRIIVRDKDFDRNPAMKIIRK